MNVVDDNDTIGWLDEYNVEASAQSQAIDDVCRVASRRCWSIARVCLSVAIRRSVVAFTKPPEYLADSASAAAISLDTAAMSASETRGPGTGCALRNTQTDARQIVIEIQNRLRMRNQHRKPVHHPALVLA